MATSAKKSTIGTTKAKAKPKSPARKAVVKSRQPDAPTSAATGAAPAAETPTPTVVAAPEPMIAGPALRKKEIIEAVVTRSGMKRRDVKSALDALLGVMGDGIEQGRDLVVPPLGRLKVHRQKTTSKKTIFFAKVHQNKPHALGPSTKAPQDET